ncbi:ARPP-1 family domain-containing protein [Blastococcus sp. SYSU D00669]
MPTLDVRLHVGQGTHRGPLTFFPVWTDAATTTMDYSTGASARVEVAERPGSPDVGELVLTNREGRPVLLLAGELLEGGWQHRALATTTLLPSARPSVERVVCVEEGRWGGPTAHSRSARRAPVAVLSRLDGEDAQQRVWARVRGYDAVAGPSPTGSLSERLDPTIGTAAHLTRGLAPLSGQHGVVIGVAGKPAWLEVFDTHEALVAHWPGLLQAAALDGLGRPAVRTSAALARSFAERVEASRLTAGDKAGLGRRFAARGRVRVDGLRWQQRTVHLTATDLAHPLQEA